MEIKGDAHIYVVEILCNRGRLSYYYYDYYFDIENAKPMKPTKTTTKINTDM